MSYYRVLGLQREPFSNSPDPLFFFRSEGHYAALCRLQVAIALKRGMSVVLGDVGTGKTTLSRRLSIALYEDQQVMLRMILNPYFRTEKQFLSRLASLFRLQLSDRATALDYMEAVETYLFKVGVEEKRTVVLLIDEAQLLPDFVFELLRILLNYETNEAKILQLVLMGQMELLPRLTALPNFWDRIALKILLKPMSEGEIRDLITFRLKQAGHAGPEGFFSGEAVRAIHEQTDGYPRKVNQLCHSILEHMVMHDMHKVDEALVLRVIEKESESDPFRALMDRPSGMGLNVTPSAGMVAPVTLRVVNGD